MNNDLWRTLRNWLRLVRPGPRAWTSAALSLLLAALIFTVPALRAFFGGTGVTGLLIGLAAFLLLAAVAAGIGWLAWRLGLQIGL